MTSQFEAFLSDAETKAKQKEEEEAKLKAEKDQKAESKPKKEPKDKVPLDTPIARARRVRGYVEAVYSMDKTDGNTDAPKRTPGSVLKMLVMEPDFGCVGPAFSSVTRELAMLSDDQMERIAHAIAHAHRIAHRCYGTVEAKE
jgi:hypothetical protein